MRRRGLLPLLAAAVVVFAWSSPLAADGVLNGNPYWFEDTYQALTWTDVTDTTAVVDTAGTGTVRLPALSGDSLAYAPSWMHADVLEVATATGVQGWGFDGAALVREPFLDVSVADPAGVSFLDRGTGGATGEGIRLAVGTGSGVSLYGWNGSVWVAGLTISDPGVVGVAAGPEGGVLAATASGFRLYSPGGSEVTSISGLAGIRGIVSTRSGAVVAVWTGGGATFYGWDGTGYSALSDWSEPVPSGGSLLGVAFFRGGGGYWLATPTQAQAFAWSAGGMVPLTGWDVTSMPATASAVSPGWDPGSLAVLNASGIAYSDPQTGGGYGPDGARSITGQTWAVFAPSATFQSTVLPGLTHDVDEVKLVDTMEALPSGTALAYWTSTDGGSTWTETPPDTPTAVPAGDQLVYQAVLSTTDQGQTPILDTTDLYEIATETITETNSVSWLWP